jgi:hypothetical protein
MRYREGSISQANGKYIIGKIRKARNREDRDKLIIFCDRSKINAKTDGTDEV